MPIQTSPRFIASLLLLVGSCVKNADEAASAGEDDTGGADTTPMGTSEGQTPSASSTSSTGGGFTTSGGAGFDTSGSGTDTMPASFLVEPDGGNPALECSIFEQDCEMGKKCMPWENDGTSSWNATKCTDIAPEAKTVGDSCKVEGGRKSGIDDCDGAAMCWDVDEATSMGQCRAFCQGAPDASTCADPEDSCLKSNGGAIAICAKVCDPLAQDCGDPKLGCYFQDADFNCVAARPAAGMGDYGAVCEFRNTCNPGLACVGPANVPSCAPESKGCCSNFCDLSAKDPSEGCPDKAMGQVCVPFFTQAAPPEYMNVGVCGIMQ